jgi:hypothetical protein
MTLKRFTKALCITLGLKRLTYPNLLVRKISIEGNSFLCLTVMRLNKIAENFFQGTPYGELNADKLPEYVADDFKLIMSVTNTNGLSYAVDFMNENLEKPYFITDHRDYYSFTFKQTNDIEYTTLNNEKDWALLAKASVATGAFPVGLPPVKMDRPAAVYQSRINNTGLTPFNLGGEVFSYYGIDGGTVDNEPLSKIQDLLEDEKKNDDTDYAVIFIDPFPSERKLSDKNNIMINLGRLYSVFRNQAAYKPEEIKFYLEQSTEKKFNSFFIAPKRSGTSKDDLQVAGGAFAAFGGFVHESFRHFDYNLGMRNCQKFLMDYMKFKDGKSIINVDTGDTVKPLSWPHISEKEFNVIVKPLNKRVRKIATKFNSDKKSLLKSIQNGLLLLPFIPALPIILNAFKIPSKLLKDSLKAHKLIQ